MKNAQPSRSLAHRRGSVLTAMLLATAGVSCDSLWVTDAPRPTLKHDDEFDVVPACPDLVIDPKAVASVQRLVTLTGRRAETNLGAESVPVTVSIGPCSCTSADGAVVVGDQDAAVCAASASSSMACSSGLEPYDAVSSGAFTLVAPAGLGCQQRSPLQLDCTLDANGEAAFAVSGSPDDSSPQVIPQYLPVCVSPATTSGPHAMDKEVRLIPHQGTAHFAAAIVALDGNEATPATSANATCEALIDCASRRQRGQFRVGIVSADVPVASIRQLDFLTVSRDVSLSVELAAASGPAGNDGAFLSTDASCQAPEGGTAATVSLFVQAGHSGSGTFYLCAPGAAASYRLTPSSGDTATTDADAAASSAVSIMGRSLDWQRTSLTHGYVTQSVGGQDVLFVEDCDGQRTRAPVSAVSIVPPFTVAGDAVVIVPCAAAAPASPVDASDDAADASEPQDADSATCGPITLELKPEGTCRLDTPSR